MAFSKISDTEVSGTGTIADLVTTIANTTYAETVGIRTVHIKSSMEVSGASSVLTVPAGWHIDVATGFSITGGATIEIGDEDAYGPDGCASMYFDTATTGSFTDGSFTTDDNANTIALYNSLLIFNSNGSSNQPCIFGNNKYTDIFIIKNSVINITGTNGSIYMPNMVGLNSTIIGGVGGEFVNSPTNFNNVIFKRMGSQGLKIYPDDTEVRGVVALGDCTSVFTIDNGKTYTVIDSTFDDDQVIFDSDGTNLNNNTFLEQYSLNGTYSVTGIAQTGIDYILLGNDNSEIGSGTVSGAGAITEIIDSVYRHNEGDHGTTFTNRDGDWYIPWIYRARKYDLQWTELELAPSDAVDVSTGLALDSNVTQASGTASAHTGITVTDHGTGPVTWNSLEFGITVTGNLTTNSSLTIADIKHYLKYHLSDDTSFNGKASGLMWHDLIPMGGTDSLRGWVFGPRLTATASASATTITISSNTGIPSAGVMKIEDEEIAYTGTTATSLTGVTRAQNGTTAAIHTFADGSPIYLRLAKGVRVVDESGNSFPGVTSHQGDDGSYYNAPVPIKITVKDINTLGVIQDARVYLETGSGGPASAGVEIINELTDINGEVNDTYNYTSDQPVVGRVRKGTP